ncbi:MAG: hypothetical protein D3925_10040, partial [Candidatus Electrothrix sp. AR5]|nr:hypothetical protein [Candidatus Electrothrix sp. AR5]
FKKISQAAVFVPDLTFVGQSSSGRQLPNPNVLIEYGWALKALGHDRIVSVMNTVAGEPTADTMPFDMRHLRNPITYHLSETDGPEQRKKVKAELAKDLERALGVVFKHMPAEDVDANVFAAQPETFSPSAFWAKSETFAYGTQHLSIPDVPRMFLRLIPKQPLTTIETSKRALDLIQAVNLRPMSGGNIGGWDYERNSYGAFSRTNDEGAIRHLSQLFKTGEIWGVDAWTLPPDLENDLAPDFGYFPCVLLENIFIKTLDSYLKFAHEKLQLLLPLKLIVGATDVREFRMGAPLDMRFNHTNQFGGKNFENDLIKEMTIDDYDTPPRSILMPFFEYVWEECGLNRPDKESLR